MSAEQTLMSQGKCPECYDGILQHGPWSQDQMQAVADDIGMPVEDFIDTCDQCFIDQVAGGDVAWAQSMCPDHILQTTTEAENA